MQVDAARRRGRLGRHRKPRLEKGKSHLHAVVHLCDKLAGESEFGNRELQLDYVFDVLVVPQHLDVLQFLKIIEKC